MGLMFSRESTDKQANKHTNGQTLQSALTPCLRCYVVDKNKSMLAVKYIQGILSTT